MIRNFLAASTIAVLSLIAVPTLAASWSWYVIPADQGDCGDECYTPPTAWIDEIDGPYSLGITCDGEMVIDGPVDAGGQFIDRLDMVIDGQAIASFEIISGLNDFYVRFDPDIPGATGKVRNAILSGTDMVLTLRKAHKFTLGGSRRAIDLMERLCREQ